MTSKPGSTSGGRSIARRYAALPISAVVTERVGVPRTEIFSVDQLQILLGCLQHVRRYLRDSIAENEGGLAPQLHRQPRPIDWLRFRGPCTGICWCRP